MGTICRNYDVEPLRQTDEIHHPYGHPQTNPSSSLGKWFYPTESRTMYPTESINYLNQIVEAVDKVVLLLK